MKIEIFLVLIVLTLTVWLILTYNKLISSRIKVREAFSTIDVFLKKRFDLIPNLVQIVKGYMNYEHDTLSKIVELRNNNFSNNKEQIDNESKISHTISQILIISENYPILKSDKHFLELQKELKDIEDEIELSRRYYNGTVRLFNTQINSIPNNIVAYLFKIKEEPFFDINNDYERKTVNIDIN